MAPSPKACSACAVRDTAICRVLNTQQLARLNRRSYRRLYPAGQLIAGVAASEDWCATVLSGVIKLSKTLSDGRQQIVALLFPGDFLGRPFRASFPYTAETATEVQLCCYGRAYFEGYMQEQSDLKQSFPRAYPGLCRRRSRVDARARPQECARESGGVAADDPATHVATMSRLRTGCMPAVDHAAHTYRNGRLFGSPLGNRQPPVKAAGSDRGYQEARCAAHFGARCRGPGPRNRPGFDLLVFATRELVEPSVGEWRSALIG